jgi:hypothetical protein
MGSNKKASEFAELLSSELLRGADKNTISNAYESVVGDVRRFLVRAYPEYELRVDYEKITKIIRDIDNLEAESDES